jgi:N-acetylneuraminate epimerase
MNATSGACTVPEADSPSATTTSRRWPDLPVGVKSGVSARLGDTLYVGLGSANTDLYGLDLRNLSQGWVKQAAFIGPAKNSAAAAASNGKLYVFSGTGKASTAAASPIIFDTVHAFDAGSNKWTEIDTRTPVGLSGAAALAMPDGRIAFVGGYSKELFDQFLADISAMDKDKDKEPEAFKTLVASYMGMKPRDYRWNDKVLVYDPAANDWFVLDDNPYLPNCDSAVAARSDHSYVLVGGEIKPGLRTPEVKSVSLGAGGVTWKKLADLPALSGGELQEGVAGAFATAIGDTVLVAGGTNFKGARANSEAGRWFAHDGLEKIWRRDVYALSEGTWDRVGSLPYGLAYGAAFATKDGLLVAGGEDADGNARSEVFELRWDGRALSIVG